MGVRGSKTTQVNSTITDMITDIMMEDVMDCTTNISASQILEIAGSNIQISGISQTQNVSIDSSCFQNAEKDLALQQKIVTEISAKLKEQSIAGLSWLNNSEKDIQNHIENNILTKIGSKTLADCTASATVEQRIGVVGENIILADISKEQTLSMVRECMQGTVSKVVAEADLSSLAESETESKEVTPVLGEAIAAFGDLGTTAIIVIVIVIAVILMAIVGTVIGVVISKIKKKNAMSAGFELEGLELVS